MAIKWFCDVTGKEVFLSPPYEVEKDKEGKPVHVPLKVQDHEGNINIQHAPKLKYLKEKGYLVRLSIGDENIQRTLCAEELDKIKIQLKHVWDLLEKMG